MHNNINNNVIKTVSSKLLVMLLCLPAMTHATVFSQMSSSIFTSNSSYACTDCHSSSLVGAVARHSAPDGADFNIYTEAASRASLINDNVSSGYMPMDPTNPADYTDAADLNPAEMAIVADWLADGAPLAAATSTTTSIVSQTKTSVTLRGTVNTNTLNSPATFAGEWHFEWGPGSTATYASGSVGGTVRNLTSSTTGTFSLTGLACGNNYHYRVVARNGNNTANGTKVNFSTSACTAPAITEGASISPPAINEDNATTFTLSRTDDDPGTLTWSVFAQGTKGNFTFDTSTTASPVTVRYTPTSNQFGSDAMGKIRVTNSTTGLSATINITMSITAVNDQPVITSSAPASANEDVLYSYQVVVDDADDSFASGLSIALSNQPGNMAVNSSTGLITWTPVNGDTTSGLVTVTVMDDHADGAVDAVQQFTVSVTGANDPPVITPGVTTTATEDVPYSYQMQFTDIDDTNNGTDIYFSLSGQPTVPSAMSISSTGLITWTPLEGVLTSGTVTVTVEDGNEDLSTPTIGNNGQESFTITVTPVNDPPSITSTAVTTANESLPYSYTVTASDIDDANGFGVAMDQLKVTLTNQPAGMAVGSVSGEITWTPPRTDAEKTYSNITVTVEDGHEDSAASAVQVFAVTVAIDDADSDLVAVYSDNCPLIKNGPAEDNQADNDNDTQYIANAGFPVKGDVDSSDPLTGGDACDTDDDNDGMPDTYEDMYAFLDPFNSADAALDEDGDGVSNLQEYLDGTNPSEDSVGPAVSAPADITVDATGLLTVVKLGKATGLDGNDGDSIIIKAAVDLSAIDLGNLDTPVSGCQEFKKYAAAIKPFRPGKHEVTWVTCDSSGNSGRDTQIVKVKPLVSVTSGQTVGEGQSVTVNVTLNGNAIAYPATVAYSLTGTARAIDDHDGVDGVVTFTTPGEVGVISFNTLADLLVESDETIIVTLHTPGNVALSKAKVHTVTITEANVAPQVALQVTQGAGAIKLGNTVYQPDGNATIIADASDANGDVLSYDWTGSNANLLAVSTVSGNQLIINPASLTMGDYYTVSVSVSDGNLAVVARRLLLIKAAEAVALVGGVDRDGDGVDDDVEGFADDDADGIANYRDSALLSPNVIENNTVDFATNFYIETDPGLQIVLADTAVAAQVSGVQVSQQDIIGHGGLDGAAVSNADTDYTFLSSLLSFEITGLNASIKSVHVVIPLQSAIQADTVYRKYNGSGWFDFVIDDNNQIRSAAGDEGSCPQPGSDLYTPGLTVGNLCLQLTIEDGGANDADGERDFTVRDPGGLAVAPAVEVVAASSNASGRVGSVSLWFMLWFSLTAILVWRIREQKVLKAKRSL